MAAAANDDFCDLPFPGQKDLPFHVGFNSLIIQNYSKTIVYSIKINSTLEDENRAKNQSI